MFVVSVDFMCVHVCFAPSLVQGALSDHVRLMSVCSTSVCVAYIGPKSRTEVPRKTTISTEVAYITRDSDIIFKVKRSKVNLQGAGHNVAVSRTSCYIYNHFISRSTKPVRGHCYFPSGMHFTYL